jgi:hypothetical protein
MESIVVASKALVQVCIPDPDGSTSYQYTMDLILDKDIFHCKFRTRAQFNDSGRQALVYLFLDASHVQSLKLCDKDQEAIPSAVSNAFLKQESNASSDSIVVLQFDLRSQAPLITPDSTLQKKRSTCDDLEALLRVGQCETFKVYVLSSAISKLGLSRVCNALAERTLHPAPEGLINSLYVNISSKKVTHIDQLWSTIPAGNPPPYDSSTAPGPNNDEASQSDLKTSTSSRAHGKRRSVSPAVHQTPSKRQLLTESPVVEPWQLAIAAQAAQIAALSAELSALREQVQQLQRAPGVDAGTQTDPVVEHEPEITPETNLVSSPVYSPVHSPAYQPVYSPAYQPVYPPVFPPVFDSQATVEITIDERFTILEGNMDERLTKLEQDIVDEQTLRSRLYEKVVQNDQLVCVHRVIPSILPFAAPTSFHHIAK